MNPQPESILSRLRVAVMKCLKSTRPLWKRVALRDFKRLCALSRPKMERAAAQWLAETRREVLARAGGVKGGTAAEITKRLLDWDANAERGRELIGKVVMEIIQDSGLRLRHPKMLKQRLDPIGETAVRWARTETGKMVTKISTKTKEGIQRAVSDGIDQGVPIDKLARMLRPTIGLTDRDAGAVGRRYGELLEGGMDEDEALARCEKYGSKLLKGRAELIASTETSRAAVAGICGAFEQNGIEKVEWVADMGPGVCETCAGYNGEIMTIDEFMDRFPVHPGDECSPVAALE